MLGFLDLLGTRGEITSQILSSAPGSNHEFLGPHGGSLEPARAAAH